ncbi:MAG TPA: phage tail tape measure protein, partial [Clostridia bacterium]|nr:phage tail tape measure protein [Clostridia bacterium]
MAVRNITTKLAIEGEAQYRASLASINSELKVLNSNLNLTVSEYNGNANSMAALTAKGEALNSLYEGQSKKVQELSAALQNAQSAVTAYQQKNDTIKATLEANVKALGSMSEANKSAGKEWADQSKIISSAEAELKKLQKSSGDTGAAQDKLRASIESAKAKMSELETQTGGAAKAAGALVLENERLNNELSTNGKYLDAAQKGANEWQTKLNGAKIELNNLDAEIQKNNKYMDEAAKNADGCAESIDEFGNETKESATAVSDLEQALAAAGIAAALKEITDALLACVDASVKYESAFAGVRKTVSATEEELAWISAGIKKMSTEIPTSASEIAALAESAGQLGIQTENILGFTRVVADLGVATNIIGQQGAMDIARFAKVTGMAQTDFEHFGSSIVALGNNFATTEAEILQMSMRLAGAGAQIGMSQADIVGLAAALSSVGIEAEMGGSALSRVMVRMSAATSTTGELNKILTHTGMSLRDMQLMMENNSQDFTRLAASMGMTKTELKNLVKSGVDLENFGKISGMTGEQFKVAFEENAAGALQSFINGLANAESSGDSAIAMLQEMGITEIRLRDSLLRAANAGDLLTSAVKMSNEAWDENIALSKEANARYATTESRLLLLSNNFESVKIAVGDKLTPALGELYDAGADVLGWIAETIEESNLVVPTITAIVTALTLFVGGLTAYIVVTKLAAAATAAFNLILETNPAILIITGVIALTAAIAALVATLPQATTEFDTLSASSQKQYLELQALNEEYERTKEAYGETSTEATLLKQKIDEATAAFEDNKQTAEKVATAHREIIDAHNELMTSYDELTEKNDKEADSNARLIAKLEELISTEGKTAKAKQEILAVVEALNNAMPELGLAYDSYADSLNLSIDAIKDIAQAEADRAKHAADWQQLVDLTAEQTTLEQDLAKAKDDSSAAQERYNEALDAYNRKAAESNYMLETSTQGGFGYGLAMMGVEQALNDASAAQDEANSRLSEAQAAYDQNISSIDTLAESFAGLSEQAQGTGDAAGRTAEAANLAAETIVANLTNLAEAYADAYSSARESLDGQIGKWEEMDATAATSAESLQKTVDSQITYLKDYQTNMDSLLSRNIEGIREFASNFTDGSTESAAALAGLATATDTEISNIIASMSQVDKYKDSLATIFAELDVDLQGSLDSLSQNYADTIAEITGSTGNIDFGPFLSAVETAFGSVGVTFETAGNEAGRCVHCLPSTQ